MEEIRVTEVQVRLVDNPEDSLIGWASCVVNDLLFLSNIAVRYAKDGNVILTYPAKKTRGDSKYFYFKPINRRMAEALSKAIIDKLYLSGNKSQL